MGRVSTSRPNTEGEGMMLPFQVLPACAGYDTANLRTTNAESFSQLIVGPSFSLKRDDFLRLIVCQLRRAVLLPFHGWATGAAFVFHILHVVVVCANEKVIRPYANAIVALMQDVHPFRDWPVVDFPTNPMGFKHRCTMWCRYNPVASWLVRRGLPLPTPWAFLYISPKTLFEGSVPTSHEKHSYNYGQSQERDILLSVTANSVATLRDVCASPEQLISSANYSLSVL